MDIAYRINRWLKSRERKTYMRDLEKIQGHNLGFQSTRPLGQQATILSSRLFVMIYIAVSFYLGYFTASVINRPAPASYQSEKVK